MVKSITLQEMPERPTLLQMVLRDPRAVMGIIILGTIIIGTIFAPVITPYDPQSQEFGMMDSPSMTHVLGTDDLGRDLFTRILYGARISLFVGAVTVTVSMFVGGFLGLVSGYYGGWVDTILMRYIDIQWAFPNFIIAVWLVAVFGTGLSNVIVAISLAFLDDFARIMRGMVLSIREEEYVLAARSLGASDIQIMLKHILPNAIAPMIVLATISVSYAILGEAALSFPRSGCQALHTNMGINY